MAPNKRFGIDHPLARRPVPKQLDRFRNREIPVEVLSSSLPYFALELERHKGDSKSIVTLSKGLGSAIKEDERRASQSPSLDNEQERDERITQKALTSYQWFCGPSNDDTDFEHFCMLQLVKLARRNIKKDVLGTIPGRKRSRISRRQRNTNRTTAAAAAPEPVSREASADTIQQADIVMIEEPESVSSSRQLGPGDGRGPAPVALMTAPLTVGDSGAATTNQIDPPQQVRSLANLAGDHTNSATVHWPQPPVSATQASPAVSVTSPQTPSFTRRPLVSSTTPIALGAQPSTHSTLVQHQQQATSSISRRPSLRMRMDKLLKICVSAGKEDVHVVASNHPSICPSLGRCRFDSSDNPKHLSVQDLLGQDVRSPLKALEDTFSSPVSSDSGIQSPPSGSSHDRARNEQIAKFYDGRCVSTRLTEDEDVVFNLSIYVENRHARFLIIAHHPSFGARNPQDVHSSCGVRK